MGLTLKIALGVFAGAIAAYLAINAPGWMKQARFERYYEKADQTIQALTPDLVIQRCGKPWKDVLEHSGNRRDDDLVTTRTLYYRKGYVELYFVRFRDGGFHWPSMFLCGIRCESVKSDPTYPQPNVDNSAYQATLQMPCLEKGGGDE